MGRIVPLLLGVITAAPCFFLAGTLLWTWVDPMSVRGGRWVPLGVGIMVLEFVLVHSGAMMAGVQRSKELEQWKTVALMMGFYALFAATMSAAFKSWDLFLIFTAVMVTRWARILTDPDHAPEEAMRRSGMSIIFYLLAAFASLFVPLPELGLTTQVLNEVYPFRGGGEWERYPEKALFAGVLYFSLLGLAEIVAGFRAPQAAEAGQELG
jgi:hypothetical protein